jgi:hypothetical protein
MKEPELFGYLFLLYEKKICLYNFPPALSSFRAKNH